MLKWILLTAIAMAPSVLHAQDAQTPLGAGVSTCRHFNAVAAFGNPAHTAYFLEWAAGYLAGRTDQGAALEGEFPDPVPDLTTLFEALAPHCKANADDLFADAVREIAADRFGR